MDAQGFQGRRVESSLVIQLSKGPLVAVLELMFRARSRERFKDGC